MARNNPILNADSEASQRPSRLFVDAMAEEDVINQNTFTFAVDQAGESKVFFGKQRGISDIVWMNAFTPDFWWSFHHSQVAFGNIENSYSY